MELTIWQLNRVTGRRTLLYATSKDEKKKKYTNLSGNKWSSLKWSVLWNIFGLFMLFNAQFRQDKSTMKFHCFVNIVTVSPFIIIQYIPICSLFPHLTLPLSLSRLSSIIYIIFILLSRSLLVLLAFFFLSMLPFSLCSLYTWALMHISRSFTHFSKQQLQKNYKFSVVMNVSFYHAQLFVVFLHF